MSYLILIVKICQSFFCDSFSFYVLYDFKFQIGRVRQKILISFFAIPIDFACLILEPILFQSLVAYPTNVFIVAGSITLSFVIPLVKISFPISASLVISIG